MNKSKSHYCWEGEQWEILLGVSIVLADFRKGPSAENLLFRREGMADRLKLGKLLNLIGHIGDRTRQFLISLL